jgi:predicted NBD/HSP70 family sugar kinase
VTHQMWEQLLHRMSDDRRGGSPGMLAEVLTRVALADEPVARSAISKGGMLVHPATLASGTVGKAAEALVGEDLLVEEDITRSGQPGPPVTPLRLGHKWAIVGIHIDQQHDGPDTLSGVICGLDRKPLTDLVEGEVPRRKGDQHDLRRLAEEIRKITGSLLAQLDGPRKFLGVGVEIGGHVYRGKVEDSVHAGWSQKVDLQGLLAEVLDDIPELRGVPGIAENDVNALAIHGYYERSFKGPDVVLLTVFRQGVGGALLLDDHMYRGIHGMAPEPGHLDVEYPEDHLTWEPPPTPGPAKGRTFGDECLCSTKDRKKYGHLDTLAVPARIEGQLAALKNGEEISLEKAAAAPRYSSRKEEFEATATVEALVLRRAGRALGRAITHMINTLNPGQLVLRLPVALAEPAPGSSGINYRDAVEGEIDRAYSTGAADARGGHFRLLTIQSYDEGQVAQDGAVAAATTVFNAFIEHARGHDGCGTDDDDDPGRGTPHARGNRAAG